LLSCFLDKHINIKMQRTIVLPVVYGYTTWSLTYRKEYRQRPYEKRVVRKRCGPKM
jgi:hypothetical protein